MSDPKKFVSLAEAYPEIVAEWHPTKNGDLKPEDVSYGSTKKVWWICDKGHEWQASVNNRVAHKSGCPYCAGRRVIKGETDIATRYPDLAAEWDAEKNDIKPDDVSAGSNKRVWWTCPKCGHSWQASVANRSKGSGCPACAGRRNQR